jgi:RHS repeat-associated protein
VVLATATAAEGQVQHGDVFDQFFRYTESENHAFFSEMPGETVDPFTGTLRLVKTDVMLPGAAGLDLRIVRTYSSKIWGRADMLDMEPLLAEKENSVLGYGWTFHFGRLRDPTAMGDVSICYSSYPVFEDQEGNAHVFYPLDGSYSVFLSKDFWRMELNCGLGACIWSNSGIRYDLSQADQFWVGMTPIWPVKRVVDPFENAITVAYVSQTGAPDHVVDTYGRQVDFDYDAGADGLRLTKMTVNGKEYQYSYVAYAGDQTGGIGRIPLPNTRRFLREVQPPAGPSEQYEYAYDKPVVHNQYALSKITYTTGGSTSYRYDDVQFFTGRDTLPFSVVVQRTVHDRLDVALGEWHYAYSSPGPGPDYNVTTITRPDLKHDVYTIIGFGYVAGNATLVKRLTYGVGLVLEIDRGDGAEMEYFSWDGTQLPPISPAHYAAPVYSNSCGPYYTWDDGVYVAVQTDRYLLRDGALYRTQYSNFDDYGQPRSITETGRQGAIGMEPPLAVRSTTNTYFYAPVDETLPDHPRLNMVRGMPATQEVCIGDDCVSSAWTYRPFSDSGGPRYSKSSETKSGVTTAFQYDPSGRLTGVTNALGQTLTLSDYAYGVPRHIGFNGAFSITRTVYPEGWIASQTDGRSHTTHYQYDAIGRQTLVTPPGDNEPISYVYAPDSSSVTATRGAYVKTTQLDGLGREVATSDTEGVLTTTRYDGMGRAWFRSYPHDLTTREVGVRSEFDALGRVAAQTNAYRPPPVDACETPGACRVTSEYVANCVSTSVERGANDVVTTWRCSTSYGDPQEGRLTQVYDAAGGLWTYGYSTAGSLTSVIAPLAAGNRSYSYDSRQFLVSETTGESGTITYGRNAIGQMTSRSDGRPVTVGYGHEDPLSRLRTVDYADGLNDVSMNYDRSNNLEHLSSARGGSFDYGHDELNRPVSGTWTYGGRTYTTGYHYDRAGCLDRIEYPTGSVVTATCDTANRPTSMWLDGAAIVTDVTYHPSGQVAGVTFGNGLRTEYGYDDRGRATAVSSPAVDLRYGYDGADNVTSFANLSMSGSSRTMTYDGLDRLRTYTDEQRGLREYQYDALGNRAASAAKDLDNYSDHALDTGFGYDANNRIAWASREIPQRSMTFEWDEANRLVASSDGATYRYDGHDRRVQKSEAGGTTVYHYDAAGRLIAETLPDGTKVRDYVYLGNALVAVDGCMEAVSSSVCSERQWYHTDTLGSVLARTDPSGTVVTRFDYRPWGQVATVAGVAGDRQYNGRVYDAGTGLHDYGARMYWPQIGRFVSADTYLGEIANPASLNKYAYVLNNPYRYRDPTGHSPRGAYWGALIGGTIGGVVGFVVGGGGGVLVAILTAGGGVVVVPAAAVGGGMLGSGFGLIIGHNIGDWLSGGTEWTLASGPEPTSNAARREAMRQQGIPTSQQPQSQSQDEAGRVYGYEVARPGGGTQEMSVQQQTMDRSHPGTEHWEAGRVKVDDEGKARTSRHGRPQLTNDKSKVEVKR